MSDDRPPRSDVLARRFLNGLSVFSLAHRYGIQPLDVEDALRRHLERLLAKKRRSKR